MALGRRPGEQQLAWIASSDLPRSPGHPFYQRLNHLLAEVDFDRWLEDLCAPHYAERNGRPSIPPGVYFRMILVGYFEGISSQRGIAWRCHDSRSLAEFLGVPPTAQTPDHSSLTRIHQRLPQSVHEEVFRFVLGIAARKKLLGGTTTGLDSTTLEANAAMKSIAVKDSGESYREYLKRLAQEAGIAEPSAEDLQRFDRQRKGKKLSNDTWVSQTDPDSRIAKMKDGTTHLAYKGEHVVELETEFILAAEVHEADRADTATAVESVLAAQVNLVAAQGTPVESDATVKIKKTAMDKGYHAVGTLVELASVGIQTYVAEPQRRQRWNWTARPAEERAAVLGNRRRVRGVAGKRWQRQRSERVERSFAHLCETGGARRCWLRGLTKVRKRYLLQAAARNLGLLMRKLFGMGTPRGLQRGGPGWLWALWTWWWSVGAWGAPVDSPAHQGRCRVSA